MSGEEEEIKLSGCGNDTSQGQRQEHSIVTPYVCTVLSCPQNALVRGLFDHYLPLPCLTLCNEQGRFYNEKNDKFSDLPQVSRLLNMSSDLNLVF